MAVGTPDRFRSVYELGPSNGRLTIHTGRAGMAARAGHDLVIEAERWNAAVDTSEPRLRATVDATSLQIREGHGGVKPLTDSDREEIRRNLNAKVLDTDRHAEITFVSTAVHALNDRRWQVDGELTIAGTTVQVRIPVEIEPDGDGTTRMSAAVTITQSDFGIKPYSAMMGALKVADDVEIRAEALVPAEAS